MRTRSSSNLPVESSPNPTTSNLKRRNRRRSKQPFILEESPVDTMADQRTMEEFLCAPTEGYAEAIVCLASGGNTFPKHRDNIQGYVAAAVVNYNQGNSNYRPLASMSNQANELKNMMASFFQINIASTSCSGHLPSNTITTRSGIVPNGLSIPIPPSFINLEEDERVEETLTDQDLAEYTIKVPPPFV
nr:hypothetical protein [Tanacetum cinerariifolium]